MPLAFPSLSHGQVAFGFFNIETDLLLLEHYFLFADRFCDHIAGLARLGENESAEEVWPVYTIENPVHIGDLMGAIHAVRHTGFIGEVYTRFPFPLRESEFKQNPEGYRTRPIIEEILKRYAAEVRIPFVAEQKSQTVHIGEYRFTRRAFLQLVEYVWLGGYPRWKDEIRPEYVMEMMKAIEESQSWLFEGMRKAESGRRN